MHKPKLPPEVDMLGAKEIRPRDCFVLHGEGERYFTVSKSGHILDLDGIRAPFTENDIWERFDRIEKITRTRFDQAAEERRELLWKERGQPGSRELASLAERFADDYRENPEGSRWHWVCGYDEETLQRLAEQAAERLGDGTASSKRKRFRELYRDVVLTKALRVKRKDRLEEATEMKLPKEPAWVMARLEERGYEAYAVGGCVRDSLLQKEPQDWDICTSALPQETLACFPDCRVIETGVQHGTVTILREGISCEVTTYRVDGGYTDSRHPDEVRFVRNLHEDLARRDFTVNAMAYHPYRGLTDDFGGRADLREKLIRCVGDPDKRFREDALRILRALRFASLYGFRLEEKTALAVRENRDRLQAVAPERIRAELCKLLIGQGAERMLLDFPEVFAVFLPEILPAVGFDQRSPYHSLDVWAHTARAVGCSSGEQDIRLALLLHDLGKPACCTGEESGNRYFYGHVQKSMELAGSILRRLRFDNGTRERVLLLISRHDAMLLPEAKSCKRWLNRIGEEAFRRLIEVQRGDARGQAPELREGRLAKLDGVEACLDEVIAEAACFSLKDLAVKGNDLTAMGIPPGKQLGGILDALLDAVLEERLPNDKEALLNATGQLADIESSEHSL